MFSAVIVRASREYHSDTFMTTNVSLASPCTAPWHATHKSSSTDVDIERVLAPTPGSLGIREGAVAIVVKLLGYSIPTGLLAATIDRAVMLVVACVLGSLGYFVTGRKLRAARRTGAGGGAPVTAPR